MCYNRHSLVLLLSAVLVGAFPARAQVERVFEPGYVVSLAGDTLRGELIDDIDLENTRAVRFRSDSSELSVYHPKEILGYGIDGGRRYVSRSLAPGPHQPPKDLFLQVLVRGAASLYAFAYGSPDLYSEQSQRGIRIDEDRYAMAYTSSASAAIGFDHAPRSRGPTRWRSRTCRRSH